MVEKEIENILENIEANKPLVSIVILTKNPGPEFKRTLDLVFNQKVSFKYEVIIVDSQSNDGTPELCRTYPTTIYPIKPEEFNFGLTRDYGFSLGRGEIVMTISQDVFPDGDEWLHNMITPFDDPTVAIVQGIDVVPQDGDVFYWDKIGLSYFTREMKTWIREHGNVGMSFTSCAIRKWVWEDNKMGPVEMAEDKIFQRNIWARGHKTFFQRKARHFHSHNYTVRNLVKRCKNEGMGMRNAGQLYKLSDMIADLHDRTVLRAWITAINQSRIKSTAEYLFPLIRPLFIYYGNHFIHKYVR
jgi:rhamnosyltransferase